MVGQFVTSKAGHDKGTIYVVVAQDSKYVYLSDGNLKNPESPKKKSLKHIQPVIHKLDEELARKLQAGEKVYPEQIKLAIRNYRQTNEEK